MALRSILAVLLAASALSPALAQISENEAQGAPERMERGDFARRFEGQERGSVRGREVSPIPSPQPSIMPAGSDSVRQNRWEGRRNQDAGGGQQFQPQPQPQSPATQPVPSQRRTPNVGVFSRDENAGGWRRRGVPDGVSDANRENMRENNADRPRWRRDQTSPQAAGQPVAPGVASPSWRRPDATNRPGWRDRDRDGVRDSRDWDRNNDGRVDRRWDRNTNGVVDRRYDWNRDGRRDDGRNDHRWGQNHGGHAYGWNHNWRNDRRYDWQRYRYDNRFAYRLPRYDSPYGYRYQRFGIGIYLNSLFFSSRYWLADPYNYRLPTAEWPYRWVRYHDDVLLVDTRNGYVIDVIYDFFW
jgi:hypothetical protein